MNKLIEKLGSEMLETAPQPKDQVFDGERIRALGLRIIDNVPDNTSFADITLALSLCSIGLIKASVPQSKQTFVAMLIAKRLLSAVVET